MKNKLLPLVIISIVIFAACSKKSTPGKSETSTPPKPVATTYAGNVQALIQSKCTPCHVSSKGGFKTNFDVYASAVKFATAMVERIEKNPGERGFMPFKNPKLSPEDIAVFKKWVSDGSLEK